MKKLLLSMAAVALGLSAANAAEITINVNDATDIQGTLKEERPAGTNSDNDNGEAKHYENVTALTLGDFSFTFDKGSAKNATAYYYNMSTSTKTQNTIRVYTGSTMTISAPAGTEILSIDMTGDKGKKDTAPTVSTGNATAPTAKQITWEGNAATIEFTWTNSFRIEQLTIVTGASDKETVAAPTFTPASGTSFTENLAVTIAAVEGADIYYTLDGSNPTAASDKYEAPIVLTSTTTVKAIAVKEGMNNSVVATATYTKDEAMATLAELIVAGLDDDKTEFTYSGNATVTYVNGKNMYVEDATAALLIYGDVNTTYTQGDIISGFKGTFQIYNGTYELNANAASFGAPVGTTDVKPADFTIGTLTANDQNKYIILHDVTVDGDALTLTSGSDEIGMFNKFSVEIPAGKTQKDVVGLVSYYKKNSDPAPVLQIYPLQFQEPTGIAAIEAENGVAEYYSINGVRVDGNNLQPGIYVVRNNGKAHKVIVK
ncbi:MAG: chitobiase/beta-hexosaminidase C-terminal domain-containing protein [Muribaculaceae bacterium]|nr:chitobiase/beta-hexosaminidase C-terminal domain-containing protein [Muribaculaceae bacterium]